MPGVIVHTTTSGRRQSSRSSRNNSQSVRLCDLILKHVWVSIIVVHTLIEANITKCIGAEVLFILGIDLAEMPDGTWISMTRVLEDDSSLNRTVILRVRGGESPRSSWVVMLFDVI